MIFRSGGCASCSADKSRLPASAACGVIALAGNPNTGKSTLFNALTGLNQHTGNWPGKTVTRAEGTFVAGGRRMKVVDLPGTYSLLSASVDEQIARDFILFGKPDCTIVVLDATCLERNLNLALQVMEITTSLVVCVNLMDEAARKGIEVDTAALGRELGVPVTGTAARRRVGLEDLVGAVMEVLDGKVKPEPRPASTPAALRSAVERIEPLIDRLSPQIPAKRWIAYRLLEGDHQVREALRDGRLSKGCVAPDAATAQTVMAQIDTIRDAVGERFRDEMVASLYERAEEIARATVRHTGRGSMWDRRLDRVLTHPIWGWPLMLLMLAVVMWLTVAGANIPSSFLAGVLMEEGGLRSWLDTYLGLAAPAWLSRSLYEWLHIAFAAGGAPGWLSGLCVDGVYLCAAWVVAVMLPPMAIFFPLFTLLEDLGYLPRIAFNLDPLFQRVGAHGKQALTMCMGFGCNAAGVISCRIIDSPREKLIAILTNNFMLCNGRFPTVIAIAGVLVAMGGGSGPMVSLAAAGMVVGVTLLGVAMMLLTSSALSRTVLRGQASAFTLELPPYRRPAVGQILHRSLIDRTAFVLWRAVVFAAPAGAVIWLAANVQVGGQPAAAAIAQWLDPLGWVMGMTGVVLLAYIIAIPASEIVVPTILMIYLGRSRMMEMDGADLAGVLAQQGWTTMTGVCLLLFVLLHNPCSTTVYTIWKETRSVRWTALATLMPLAMGMAACSIVAGVWRLAMLWVG